MSYPWQVGAMTTTIQKGPITAQDLKQYASASGDYNPIHLDEMAAQKAGLEGIIAHGMLSMGYLGALMMEVAGHEGILKSFSTKFRSMVRLGDLVNCQGEVIKVEQSEAGTLVTFSLQAMTQEKQVALKGTAVVLFQ
nr:dehydratase [Bacilli bacterium]